MPDIHNVTSQTADDLAASWHEQPNPDPAPESTRPPVDRFHPPVVSASSLIDDWND